MYVIIDLGCSCSCLAIILLTQVEFKKKSICVDSSDLETAETR